MFPNPQRIYFFFAIPPLPLLARGQCGSSVAAAAVSRDEWQERPSSMFNDDELQQLHTYHKYPDTIVHQMKHNKQGSIRMMKMIV
jgi:aromatic ring-opening dioxygenase catalytic subunit (LigB family)